jgi:predicted transcriptional regulator
MAVSSLEKAVLETERKRNSYEQMANNFSNEIRDLSEGLVSTLMSQLSATLVSALGKKEALVQQKMDAALGSVCPSG